MLESLSVTIVQDIEPDMPTMYAHFGLSHKYYDTVYSQDDDNFPKSFVGLTPGEQSGLGESIAKGREAFLSMFDMNPQDNSPFGSLQNERLMANAVYNALLAIKRQEDPRIVSDQEKLSRLIGTVEVLLNAHNARFQTNVGISDFLGIQKDIITGIEAEKVLTHHFIRGVYGYVRNNLTSDNDQWDDMDLRYAMNEAGFNCLQKCVRKYDPKIGKGDGPSSFSNYLTNSIVPTLMHTYTTLTKSDNYSYAEYSSLKEINDWCSQQGLNPSDLDDAEKGALALHLVNNNYGSLPQSIKRHLQGILYIQKLKDIFMELSNEKRQIMIEYIDSILNKPPQTQISIDDSEPVGDSGDRANDEEKRIELYRETFGQLIDELKVAAQPIFLKWVADEGERNWMFDQVEKKWGARDFADLCKIFRSPKYFIVSHQDKSEYKNQKLSEVEKIARGIAFVELITGLATLSEDDYETLREHISPEVFAKIERSRSGRLGRSMTNSHIGNLTNFVRERVGLILQEFFSYLDQQAPSEFTTIIENYAYNIVQLKALLSPRRAKKIMDQFDLNSSIDEP